MQIVKHEFTEKIIELLRKKFGDEGGLILEKSELLQYLNIKTKAANRGSKSRAGFGNHYAIYVLIEDYIEKGYHNNSKYKSYEGAMFTRLFQRQRELPFGEKLQNHALNHRLNEEFKKYFPTSEYQPIIRDKKTNRYWINENLILIEVKGKRHNIAETVKEIIEAYIEARQDAFQKFIETCQQLMKIHNTEPEKSLEFIKNLLQPNVDARIFEIVSYAILKEYYAGKNIYWGWSPDELHIEPLCLYKTGRTNANDGGIDFVMRPLGRFFQVTETIDAGKYFLDIDKIQKYPITFVVKSSETVERIKSKVEEQARKKYPIDAIIKRYMECIEEVINIVKLLEYLEKMIEIKKGRKIIKEIVLQSRVEFNVNEERT